MGFDLVGIEPKSEDGKIFCNNIWSWHPLWIFVSDACSNILNEEDKQMGFFNDGHIIPTDKALLLADELDVLLRSGAVHDYLEKFDDFKEDEALGPVGMGIVAECRRKLGVRGGKASFFIENIEAFSRFCRSSGGFAIY